MSDVPEEFGEFLFGPNDNPDGGEPTDEEERRRLAALRYLAHQYAKEAGIEQIEKGECVPEPVVETDRSKEIAEVARQSMPAADENVRTSIERLKIESPDGWKVSATRIRLGVFDDLGKAIKMLADAPNTAVEMAKVIARASVRLCVQVGTMFKATVSTGEKPSEQDETDQ